ncbi:MAG: hypothetical protein ACP5R5_15050, partial [Armatimonadota bacterium]
MRVHQLIAAERGHGVFSDSTLFDEARESPATRLPQHSGRTERVQFRKNYVVLSSFQHPGAEWMDPEWSSG